MNELKDFTNVHGEVTITLRRADGSIKERSTHNLVVTTGLQHIADQMSGKTQSQMTHMAIGTGTVSQVAGDIALGTELSRKAFSEGPDQGSGADANKVTYITTWPTGEGDGDITEAGIFNAASGGTMLCRTADFGVKSKGPGDSLTLTWKIIFNA